MKILIGGDSWGCGEWGFNNQNQYGILHHGLEKYLKDDGYLVTNTSSGGSSNKDSITRLKNALNFDPDIILWFQSDPLRDNRPYDNFTTICNTWDNLINYNDSLLIENYKSLNDIGKKIYCIGGCSKIKTNLIGEFPNLIPLIKSVPEFLYEDYKHPEIWISDWIKIIDKLDSNVLKQLEKHKDKQDRLNQHFGKYTEYFWPDGRHPNRLGHLKIYEYFKLVMCLA